MLSNLKNHSVKFFVFAINILLAAIAAFVIREKDQARLLENAQKENILNENSNDIILPSFENSVESNAVQAEEPSQPLPDNSVPAVSAPSPVPAITVPTVPAPEPVKNTAPANTKTKTS